MWLRRVIHPLEVLTWTGLNCLCATREWDCLIRHPAHRWPELNEMNSTLNSQFIQVICLILFWAERQSNPSDCDHNKCYLCMSQKARSFPHQSVIIGLEKPVLASCLEPLTETWHLWSSLQRQMCRDLGAAWHYFRGFSNIHEGDKNSASRLASVMWNHKVHINKASSEQWITPALQDLWQ